MVGFSWNYDTHTQILTEGEMECFFGPPLTEEEAGLKIGKGHELSFDSGKFHPLFTGGMPLNRTREGIDWQMGFC